jgi:sortase A
MLGRISIPSIHAELPIFHGTDESTLSRGVGHLCGSSFPVGGSSTHSVLTAHSGFVNATLFDNLDKVAVGDTFQVSVLNETLNYRADQILTVLPQETDSLRRVNGKDYITLVTCTPRGINSHRLLVRGERVDSPPGPTGNEAHGGPFTEPGFPWWMLILAGTLAGSVLLTRPRPSHVSTEDCPTASATSQPTE